MEGVCTWFQDGGLLRGCQVPKYDKQCKDPWTTGVKGMGEIMRA